VSKQSERAEALLRLQAANEDIASKDQSTQSGGVGNLSLVKHNEIDQNRLDTALAEMSASRVRASAWETEERRRKNVEEFQQKIVPRLYRGKAHFPTLLGSSDAAVSGLARELVGRVEAVGNAPCPLFIYAPGVNTSIHAWAVVMRWVASGFLAPHRFLKVDENGLLTKSRSGFLGTQTNVDLADSSFDAVLYVSSDADSFSESAGVTLSMVLGRWAEDATAVVVVSPRPWGDWLRRFPRDLQEVLKTLFDGCCVEVVSQGQGSVRGGRGGARGVSRGGSAVGSSDGGAASIFDVFDSNLGG
jgi:hypothetical protein